ncbi:biliverdin-producing heme oxygenase [Komagataeibacter rhaeticus]|uniref:biliverdin-producing heme oxygenase n=1 Tax=Komagataeibacter rhaeticus TaxID=215221 RepID=UPI0024930ABE|nr:biliverdin-producing heme oxygenase [Komagataeibacter rhaeticus]
MALLNDGNAHTLLSSHVREATHQIHDDLNRTVMSRGMFTDAAGYRDFVLMQYLFHRDLDPLYNNDQLAGIVPDLAARNRFQQVSADMQDLGIAFPAPGTSVEITDPSTAMGWLYVAEGSKLGANILIRLVDKMGYGARFGARHLAADPMGRGASWTAFRNAIDCAGLDPERCVHGVRESYARIKSCIPAPGNEIGSIMLSP